MPVNTIGAGLGASFALVEEASYGVVVASPTWKFFEPNVVTPKKAKMVKQSSGLAAGRYVDVTSRRVVTERSATVSATFDYCYQGRFTTLINQISSSYATGGAGAQTAGNGIYSAGARVTPSGSTYGYTHTFRNSIAGRSAAMQIGLPTTDAVLRQYDVLGAKPTKLTWDCKAGDILSLATEWDARVLEDPLITASYEGYPNGAGQTPYTQATPSYVVQNPAHFAQAQVQIGATVAAASAATPIDGVTGFNLSVERKLNVNRQYYGNAGLKDEQITNDVVAITGTMTSDFVNKTYWADAFYSDTPQVVIVTYAAGALSGTVNAVQFVMQNVYLNDTSPAAANKDVINTSFPFVCLYDLVNEPLTVIVQTTDATG